MHRLDSQDGSVFRINVSRRQCPPKLSNPGKAIHVKPDTSFSPYCPKSKSKVLHSISGSKTKVTKYTRARPKHNSFCPDLFPKILASESTDKLHNGGFVKRLGEVELLVNKKTQVELFLGINNSAGRFPGFNSTQYTKLPKQRKQKLFPPNRIEQGSDLVRWEVKLLLLRCFSRLLYRKSMLLYGNNHPREAPLTVKSKWQTI